MKKIIISFLGLSLLFIAGCSRPSVLETQAPAASDQPSQENASQAPIPAKGAAAKAALNEIYGQITQEYKIEGKIGLLDERAVLRATPELKTRSWWMTGKNYNIMVQNDLGFLDINYDSPKDLADIAENIFVSKGFKLNKTNSSVSKADNSLTYNPGNDPGGYIRAYILENEEFCVITASENSSPKNFKIGCFSLESLNQASSTQVPFLAGLETDNQKVVVTPIILGKQAAKLNIAYRIASSSVIMKKTGNGWKEVYRGETDPACSLMTKLEIPSEIYKNCVE
ncbi:MAG: hypothetical protein WC719_00665 [Patescibacteria group bacterium]|jgi:hypothetical protein